MIAIAIPARPPSDMESWKYPNSCFPGDSSIVKIDLPVVMMTDDVTAARSTLPVLLANVEGGFVVVLEGATESVASSTATGREKLYPKTIPCFAIRGLYSSVVTRQKMIFVEHCDLCS